MVNTFQSYHKISMITDNWFVYLQVGVGLLVEAVERVRGVVPAEVVVCSAGVVNFVVITSLVVAVVCFEEVT